jgi:TonB family protein
MPASRGATLALLFLVALATPLLAQSTPDAIAARLKDRPLYIRNFWSDDTLHFDGNGDLATPSKRTPFTLDGFNFLSLKLKDGVLTITGQVVGVEFKDDKPERVNLPRLKRIIEITAPANGDFGPALDAIFADGIEALAPSLPEYWQRWVRKTYPAAYSAAADGGGVTQSSTSPVKKVGGSVSAPQILHRTDASFTEVAKALMYQGFTIVSLIVDVDGRPTHLAIEKPSGLGLDEKALIAVQQYRFKPTTENGQPVRVEADVEVTFHIY